MRCAAFFFFGGGPGLLELLCEVVDEDAADDVEGEAARGIDALDGDMLVLVAEDGGVGDARAERGGVPVAGWNIYGEYFALGGGSIDSFGWQHRLNISGGNAKDVAFENDAGTRGWGLGVGYMLAANTNLELTYYKLKPYDKDMAGFRNYDDVAYAALSYSF